MLYQLKLDDAEQRCVNEITNRTKAISREELKGQYIYVCNGFPENLVPVGLVPAHLMRLGIPYLNGQVYAGMGPGIGYVCFILKEDAEALAGKDIKKLLEEADRSAVRTLRGMNRTNGIQVNFELN